MSEKTPCPRCGTIGLIRVEHVITGGKSYRSCYCGECHYQWQVAETGHDLPRSTPDKPDRSRSR